MFSSKAIVSELPSLNKTQNSSSLQIENDNTVCIFTEFKNEFSHDWAAAKRQMKTSQYTG